MAKDPAFLFYSKDFYEGTRTMLPKERACYIDLLIYQHQHGFIPNDMERVAMYCSGIDEATLQATLQAKFKQGDEGWFNEKLASVIENRKEFSEKQSSNGIIGQFLKKAKAMLNDAQYKSVRDYIYNVYGKEKLSIELKKQGVSHEGLLKAMLKHLAIVDVIVNENKNSIKNVKFFESERLNISFSKWLTMCAEKDKQFTETSISEIVSSLNAISESDAVAKVTESIRRGWLMIPEESKDAGKGNKTTKHAVQTAAEQAGIDYGEGL